MRQRGDRAWLNVSEHTRSISYNGLYVDDNVRSFRHFARARMHLDLERKANGARGYEGESQPHNNNNNSNQYREGESGNRRDRDEMDNAEYENQRDERNGTSVTREREITLTERDPEMANSNGANTRVIEPDESTTTIIFEKGMMTENGGVAKPMLDKPEYLAIKQEGKKFYQYLSTLIGECAK